MTITLIPPEANLDDLERIYRGTESFALDAASMERVCLLYTSDAADE